MKHTIDLYKVFVVAVVSLFVLLGIQNNATAQFDEQFNSSTLDPAWQVVTFMGFRVYGYTSPANHISLTDNPGHLRYYLDPMTHFDGFAYNFQTSYGLHSCCDHDPGLELRRTISGENWLLEAKASYYLPYTNGRYFTLDVYFGDGDIGTFSVQFQRLRDLDYNYLHIILAEKTGSDPWNYPLLEDLWVSYPSNGPDYSTLYFKLERSGGMLTAMWSEDGTTWNTAFTRNTGTLLNGLTQTVVVTGLSWFVPADSYADWDYITVTLTKRTVSIDIKPGDLPNSINPKSKGKIPVAILTNETFDATTVDPTIVRFGKTGTEAAPVHSALEDVNGDGNMDMILHFNTQETGIECLDTSASLTGETLSGQAIEGSDSIKTVGCK